jgi:hypothetical protein
MAAIALAGVAAHAESVASMAISNSVSASVGSVSTSFNASSDASSPGRAVRAGAWRVIEMAAAPGREGYARLTLRAEPAAASEGAASEPREEQHLFLPEATVAAASLAVGQVIHARERPYGLELAKAEPGAREATPFFLVLADEVYRELQTRAVRL